MAGASDARNTRQGHWLVGLVRMPWVRSMPSAAAAVHTEEVTGSIPVSPTAFSQLRGQLISLMIWPLDRLTVV